MDSDAVRKKFAEEQGAAIKIQKAFKKSTLAAGAGAGAGAGATKAAGGGTTERKAAAAKTTGKTAETKTTIRSPKGDSFRRRNCFVLTNRRLCSGDHDAHCVQAADGRESQGHRARQGQ